MFEKIVKVALAIDACRIVILETYFDILKFLTLVIVKCTFAR